MTTATTHKRAQVIDLVRELAMTWQAIDEVANSKCRKTGLNGSQFDVLMTLGTDGPLTFKDIGEKTRTVKTTLTGLIDRLEEKGLVRRTNCSEDRRCTFVELTEAGQTFYAEAYPAHVAWMNQHFTEFEATDIQQCQRFLRRLRAEFTQN